MSHSIDANTVWAMGELEMSLREGIQLIGMILYLVLVSPILIPIMILEYIFKPKGISYWTHKPVFDKKTKERLK